MWALPLRAEGFSGIFSSIIGIARLRPVEGVAGQLHIEIVA